MIPPLIVIASRHFQRTARDCSCDLATMTGQKEFCNQGKARKPAQDAPGTDVCTGKRRAGHPGAHVSTAPGVGRQPGGHVSTASRGGGSPARTRAGLGEVTGWWSSPATDPR